MEVLTAYVRANAPRVLKETQPLKGDGSPEEKLPAPQEQSSPKLAVDIQAILTVLGRRTETTERSTGGEWHVLDLRKTDLRGASLEKASLPWVQLEEADLEGADLTTTHLEGANLTRTNLMLANLTGAHLQGVFSPDIPPVFFNLGPILFRAKLVGAHLERANLKGANLEWASLRGAYLEGADLTGANLMDVHNVTVEQLAAVKTLYDAHLDPPLLEQIRQQFPHLLKEPQK
jgi:Pentapeptide repeats (8 copies)